MNYKNKLGLLYAYGLFMLMLGIVFNGVGIGMNEFAGFPNFNIWLIFVGFISLIIAMIKSLMNKKSKIDERDYFIAEKARGITFLVLFIVLFVIIVIDGLKPLTLAYHMFISYLMATIMITYTISFKFLERKY